MSCRSNGRLTSVEEQEPLASGSDMPDPEVHIHRRTCGVPLVDGRRNIGWFEQTKNSRNQLTCSTRTAGLASLTLSKASSGSVRRPRQVQARWRVEDQERRSWVPVLDEFGRFAATALPQLDIEEAWGQLDNFPMPPDEEELCPNGDTEPLDPAAQQSIGGPLRARYPVRQMMELVENIAAKQTSVSQADWTMWCTRLEQCLSQAAGSKILEEFMRLKLNPLSPLWHPPFRPDFAQNADTPEGLRYEAALKRVETAWHVDNFSPIGNEHEAGI